MDQQSSYEPPPNPGNIKHRISDVHLHDFIVLYERVTKKRLTYDEARVIAERLLRLYSVIGRPLPKSNRKGGAGI